MEEILSRLPSSPRSTDPAPVATSPSESAFPYQRVERPFPTGSILEDFHHPIEIAMVSKTNRLQGIRPYAYRPGFAAPATAFLKMRQCQRPLKNGLLARAIAFNETWSAEGGWGQPPRPRPPETDEG